MQKKISKIYKFIFISIFPDLFPTFLNHSVLKRAFDQKKSTFQFLNIRDFSQLKNQQIDDFQIGPGKGMVFLVEPLSAAIDAAQKQKIGKSALILLTPQGVNWTQQKANDFLNNYQTFIFISGNYEGFDERIRKLIDFEISIGDYILTGGELPSLVLANSLLRLIPNVIKNDSKKFDSFENGRLDYPVYAKPRLFKQMNVPEILWSGNHFLIKQWRLEQSLIKTAQQRPDLFQNNPLTDSEKEILKNNSSLRKKIQKIIKK